MKSRFLQQQIIPEIGIDGQKLIEKAKVLIIGAGGLGTPVATYLATAGVGEIGLVDGDTISESNLHRQFMYSPADIGKLKVQVLKQRLSVLHPESKILAFPFFLNTNNSDELIRDFDILCDCSDNAETRLLINQLCKNHSKTLIYAAVRDWQGYLTILYHQSKTEIEDLFSIQQLQDANNCSISGIVNTTCGIIGSLQACEVLKIILGQTSELDGKILCVDTRYSVFRIFRLQRKSGVGT